MKAIFHDMKHTYMDDIVVQEQSHRSPTISL